MVTWLPTIPRLEQGESERHNIQLTYYHAIQKYCFDTLLLMTMTCIYFIRADAMQLKNGNKPDFYFIFLNNNKRMNSTPNSQQDVTSELFVLHSSAGGYSAIVAKARETFLGSTDMNEKSNHDSRVGGGWWRISVVVGHSLPFSWERGRGKPRGRSGVFFFFSFFRLSSFAWAWTHPELVTGLGAGSKHEQRVRVEPSWIGTHADESHSRGQKNVL